MAAEEKPVTERQFLENWGLYRALHLPRQWHSPTKLSRDCPQCKKETTWAQRKDEIVSSRYLHSLEYGCVDCDRQSVVFVIYTHSQWDSTQQKTVASQTWIVGQIPQPSARISRALEGHLGDDAQLYKRGLTCRNEGFGIGAVSYIRRVVENKTNELIDIVAELAATEGLSSEQVEKLRAAKNNKAYDMKLEVAAPLVPTSLRPGGVNPLGELHRLLSLGLHGRTEDECLQIADDTREIFEYVFERLRAQIEDHSTFKERVTKIASKWMK